MKFKVLKHDDGKYGLLTYNHIVKQEYPILYGISFSNDNLESYFANCKNKEEIIKGWKVIEVTVNEDES